MYLYDNVNFVGAWNLLNAQIYKLDNHTKQERRENNLSEI